MNHGWGQAGLVLILVVILGGCTGGTGEKQTPPEPVSLDSPKKCGVCGMVIGEHPGPGGQIFYRGHRPENHPEPFRFDSLKQGLIPFYFDHKNRGWEARGIYVTDYSTFDFTVQSVKGRPFIDRSLKPPWIPERFRRRGRLFSSSEAAFGGPWAEILFPFRTSIRPGRSKNSMAEPSRSGMKYPGKI